MEKSGPHSRLMVKKERPGWTFAPERAGVLGKSREAQRTMVFCDTQEAAEAELRRRPVVQKLSLKEKAAGSE